MYAIKNDDENNARMIETGSCGSRETGLLYQKKLTVPEAAKAMNIGQTKLRAIIADGEIPVLRIDGKILLTERAIEAYLQANYGTLKRIESRPFNRLPSLPKHIAESELIKKAVGGAL